MAKDKNKSSLPSLKKESAVAEEKKEETQAQAAEETKSEETAAAEESAPAAEAAEAPAEEAKAEETSAEASEESAPQASSETSEAAPAAEAAAVEESASEEAAPAEASETSEEAAPSEDEEAEEPAAAASHEAEAEEPAAAVAARHEVTPVEEVDGYLAYFDYPDDLLHAADEAHKAGYKSFDAFSPFPIHGMDDAIGLGRSWLPWVTFGAGATGFMIANAMQFGMLTFDWPMIIGGKPYAPWPSFVPIMFELTVLIGGVTTALTMLVASGCFRKPRILDPEFTNDRFALWISADDAKFEAAAVQEFMAGLHPVEIKPVLKETV